MFDFKNWYKNDGATTEEIFELSQFCSDVIPIGLIELLQYTNGGEGPLPIQPFNFVLDSVSDLIETNKMNHINKQFSGFFIFGSDGGGEFVAHETATGFICFLDMCNSNLAESKRVIAQSFDEFATMIGNDTEQQKMI